jgi:hypothetical protein
VRTTMQGLGIQTLPMHVALKGVSSGRQVPVTIESSLGSVEPAAVILTGDKPAEISLRSESLGKIDVIAVCQNYRSNSLTVNATFPWLFLLLALGGGLVGGIGKDMFTKVKISGRTLIMSSIIGLIAAVAYWGLGIVLIGFSIQTSGLNEAMVFGFGLLAGYFGLVVMKK